MKNIWEFMKGKKTYFVCAATVVFALLGATLGHFTWQHALELILGAFGLGALRNAM